MRSRVATEEYECCYGQLAYMNAMTKNKEWDPAIKPLAAVCPQEFCFNWRSPGSLVALGLHEDVEAALSALVPVTEGHCGWTLGLCTRLDSKDNDRDYYEPHEPNLERAGLPWFYFIPSADTLVEEAKEAYSAEAEQLWGGEEHSGD